MGAMTTSWSSPLTFRSSALSCRPMGAACPRTAPLIAVLRSNQHFLEKRLRQSHPSGPYRRTHRYGPGTAAASIVATAMASGHGFLTVCLQAFCDRQHVRLFSRVESSAWLDVDYSLASKYLFVT